MGDIADMMLDGTLCSTCGDFLSADPMGFPMQCASCNGGDEPEYVCDPVLRNPTSPGKPKKKEHPRHFPCPFCKKKPFDTALQAYEHIRMKHANGAKP